MEGAEGARCSSLGDDLRPTLERFVSKAQARAVEINGWRREPGSVVVPGVFPIEVLRVSLRDGEEVALLVKYLGPEQADHPDKQCRDREPRIYEEWLDGPDLPVPRYYGCRWNGSTGRRELYLEYVDDWSLKYQGLDAWLPAARSLARLHARFAARASELSSCEYLLRLDALYFQQWAHRALAVVRDEAPELVDEVAGILRGYERIAEILDRQPATLVHNDLAPKNVLADRSHQPPRICFVDWEMAGVGCGLLDLVHLKHGLDAAQDRAMRSAYCAELDGTGLLPSRPSQLRRLLAACEVHLTLYRIASSTRWRPPRERLAEWVAEARERAEGLS